MTQNSDFNVWLNGFADYLCKQQSVELSFLFSEGVSYRTTPFEVPVTGRAALKHYFDKELSLRHDTQFKASKIAIEDQVGWARWSCTFTRRGTEDPVRQEGILRVLFEESGLCKDFRQWWNALEPGQGDLMRDFDA